MRRGYLAGAVVFCAALTLLATLLAAPAGARRQLPREYRSLYRTLDSQLDESFAVRPAARRSHTTFGAHLLVADSNNGPKLLDPITLPGADITLDRFKQLGIKGVSVAIGYPLFTPSRNPDAGRYIDFYKRLAELVRAHGMKLTVEQIVLYTNSNFSPWQFDLSTIPFLQLIAEQQQMAQTIIDELHPDYLTVLHEPDTYAVLLNKYEFFDPAIAAAYVGGVLQGLHRGRTKVGAGSGSWSGTGFVDTIAASTDVDYICIHVYWVNDYSVEAAKKMAIAARRRGKGIVVDEAWLYKSVGAGNEGVPGLGGNEAVFRRDVFGFFEPLDRKFLRRTTRFARTAGAEYFAPYWSNYFFAYLTYGPHTKDLSYRDAVTVVAPQKVGQAIVDGRFTGTGRLYRRLIRRR